MANKPIGMVQVRRSIQLKSEGVSKYSISKTLGVHRTTLDGYLNIDHRSVELSRRSVALALPFSAKGVTRVTVGFSDSTLFDVLPNMKIGLGRVFGHRLIYF